VKLALCARCGWPSSTVAKNPQPGMRPKARGKQSSTIGLDATRATKATRLTKDKKV
jgi:hypothetical protein